MEEPQMHIAKTRRQSKKGCILYNSSYNILEIAKSIKMLVQKG